MIVYKKGDLIESKDERRIAHGCNCSGGYNSGFAGVLRKKYPSARDAYLSKFNESGWTLGDVQLVRVSEDAGRIVANCATQERYGPQHDGPYVSYKAIKEIIKKLVKEWPEGFAIPKIGAGLAGGNWEIISEIIKEESGSTEVRVYEL